MHIVIDRSPFTAPYKTIGVAWETIAKGYGLAVKEPNCISGRKLKEKFYNLLSTFRKEEAGLFHKSETDKEYSDLDKLLKKLNKLECDSRVKVEKKVIYFKIYDVFDLF